MSAPVVESPSILRDFPQFAKSLLQIKTKDRRVVPFTLNGEQEIIWEAIKSQQNQQEPIRIAILKPRQIGASTLCQGLCWWKITTQENTHALSIAHETKATQRIFAMSQVFFDYMPVKPMRRYSTRQEIVLENADDYARIDNPGLRSRLDLGTAGKMGTGRAATTHVLHCSEVAQWPYPEDLIGGLFPSVPYEPDTMILMESTANGAGEFWHEFWQECKNGENQFIPVFIPWFNVKEYQMSAGVTARWMVKRGYDDEEKRLRRIFKISDERLAWRRMRINELKGDEDLFRQEYPCDDVEAWIVSGNPIFDTHRLLTALEKCRKPHLGYLDPNLSWRPDKRGPISMWRHPVAEQRYTIGVDVALGVRGGDYSVVEVVDAHDEQCAEWHGHIDPISFAGEIEKLGRYYNDAVVAIEVQNQGFSTQAELRKRYWNLYRWRYMDRFADRMTDKIGWESQSPDALVLRSDLQWVPSGDIQEGDWLIGCDEGGMRRGKGERRLLHATQVEKVRRFRAPMWEVRLVNGATTVVTENHPFLCRRTTPAQSVWTEAQTLRSTDRVKYLAPWRTLRSYEAGQMSAFLEAEGFLSRNGTKIHTLTLRTSQAEGPLADRMEALWHHLGFEVIGKHIDHRELRRAHHKTMTYVGPRHAADALRALGSLRPQRLLDKFLTRGMAENISMNSLDSVLVQSARPIGEGDAIGLTTQHRTLIVDGFVSHNTNLKTKPLLIAHMAHLIREGDIGIRNKELVQEMMRFIETPSGGEAAAGCHDDRVMAFMIAVWVNDVERPKGDGGSVTMPYEHNPPQSADADYALSHDLGQHLFREDEEADWRTL